MTPERLLRIGALYHGLVGVVFALLPADAARSMGFEAPERHVLWVLAAAPVAVSGGLLEWAIRDLRLRAGLVAAVTAFDLVFGALLAAFCFAEDLPTRLLGLAAASGLWAWLLSPQTVEPRP